MVDDLTLTLVTSMSTITSFKQTHLCCKERQGSSQYLQLKTSQIETTNVETTIPNVSLSCIQYLNLLNFNLQQVHFGCKNT